MVRSNSSMQPTSSWRSKRLLAALALCLALSLAFISTAIARRDHSKAPVATAPAAAAPSATGEAGAAASSSGRAGSAGTSSGEAGNASAGSTNVPSGKVSHRHDHRGNTSSGEGAAVQPASASQEAAGSSETASAQAKSKKEATSKAKRSHERKGKGKSGNGSAAGEAESESAAAGKSASSGTGTSSTPTVATPAPTATPAAAAPAATTATTAPAATTLPATSTATPAAGSRASRRARRSTRLRRHGATTQAGLGVLTAAGSVPVGVKHAAPAARSRHAHSSKKAAKRTGRPSALVTTITKIVGVVPLAVRLLIAALFGLALAFGVRSRVAALRARRLERQRVQLLEDVGLLQAALLPVPPARLGPVGTSAAYQPAAGPGAGGDFYDVFALADGQLAVIVGDVSGHGREALPHTALVRFTLRAYLEAGLSPRDAIQTAGAVLERQLGGVFATVIAATYQPRDRMLVYASAGHPPPVVLGSAAGADADGAAAQALEPVTASASPPIGVGARTGMRQSVVSIPGRAQVCFYTDGLTEARVGTELFGTERLAEMLAGLGSAATAAAVLERVAEHADARPDDMAACLLSIEGDDGAPVALFEELELDRNEAGSARTERFLLACGVERHEVAEVMRAAAAAAGSAGTVVLEVRHTDGGPPEVTLQREQIAYLHARRADVEVAL
jgi:serine phosphatase RsbU (regulator of sigma subunit)